MMAVLTLFLLCSLPMFRRWLREKREWASRGRIFKYRRFLTPEQLERRRRVLYAFVRDNSPLVYIHDIGAVWSDRLVPSGTVALTFFDSRPLVSRIASEGVCPPGDATVCREDFEQHPIRTTRGPWAHSWCCGVALLIDEEDRAGCACCASSSTGR